MASYRGPYCSAANPASNLAPVLPPDPELRVQRNEAVKFESRTIVLYSGGMLDDLPLAFVDLETTGTSATSDRITEIGIVRCMGRHMSEWSSLVNPQTRIPPFIEDLTGISNQMVADAPLFEDLATTVLDLLEGHVFVAHNARFDHGFLKNEFRRLGFEFGPDVLCTVRLSRHLHPGFARHNLDSLIERHQLTVSSRHRALGDARLIWQFWEKLRAAEPEARLTDALHRLTARPALPAALDPGLIDRLPTTAGVYLFYGENDLPLYIGKANHVRRRVLSHFSADHQLGKSLNLSQQLRRIDWRTTAGELGALLLEATLVKQLQPLMNRQLRKKDKLLTWRAICQGETVRLALTDIDDLFFGHEDHLHGLYGSAREASAELRALAEAHALCPVVLRLEKLASGRPCFASQIGRCRGACHGKETRAEHDARLLAALEPIRVLPWPFAGAVALREAGDLHVINAWHYLGTTHEPQQARQLARASRPHAGHFDRDIYLILKKWLDHPSIETLCLTASDVETHESHASPISRISPGALAGRVEATRNEPDVRSIQPSRLQTKRDMASKGAADALDAMAEWLPDTA